MEKGRKTDFCFDFSGSDGWIIVSLLLTWLKIWQGYPAYLLKEGDNNNGKGRSWKVL